MGNISYQTLLQEIDRIWDNVDHIFNEIWRNYKANFKDLVYNLTDLQKEYEEFLENAAEALGLGAGFLIEAAKLWLESKDELFEEDRKAKKWGAVALGLAGAAAAGYSIYQTYKAQKKIKELKEKLKTSLQKLLEERRKLIDLKVQSLNKIRPYVDSFKRTSIILMDILYSLGQDRPSEVVQEIYQRLDKIIPVYLKFNIILLTIDFFNKNYRLLYQAAFINPSFIFYIREISYKTLDEIFEVFVYKYNSLNKENPVVKYIIQSPLIFYTSKWFKFYKELKIENFVLKEGNNVKI